MENNNILDLIPQRPPMVMVDEFLGIDDAVSKTRFTVKPENIFVDDGLLSECGLIEHIAQSAAARIGYICRSRQEPVRLGYIGSVNDFTMAQNPKIGDVVCTTIEIIQEVFGISLIQARCCVNGSEIASCKMKIFLEQS